MTLASVPSSNLSHIAVIMDGNGRWAKQQGLPRHKGHKHGLGVARRFIRLVAEQTTADYLTLFTFSNENWARPQQEVKTLLSLFSDVIRNEEQEFIDNRIRLRFIGDTSRFPLLLQKGIAHIEKVTNRVDCRLTVILAVSYSGRWDIVQAAKTMAAQNQEFTEENFARHLATADMPPPDLLIRTGGERRVSNFMLWQLAYTELYFTSVLWPDFTEADIHAALADFSTRERRFGAVVENA